MSAQPQAVQSSPSVLRKECPSHNVLKLITGEWSVLVLYALQSGKLRYGELQRTVGGISQKMLTQTLRELERDGLVHRTLYPVVPPHTEYELTSLGRSMEDIVCRLGDWAQDNMLAVLEARRAYDGRESARLPV